MTDKEKIRAEIEEAARNYGDELDNVLSVGVDDDNSIGEYATQAFKAGAKWQKEQILDCNTTLQRTFELGKQEMKQQMLAKAIDGQLENGEDYLRIKCLHTSRRPQDDGKLVKLIIIKEGKQ